MYNHRLANIDKESPSYELKIIMNDGDNEIRKLLYLQQNYNPSPVEMDRKLKTLIAHLEKKYGSIAKVRLSSKEPTLTKIIADNVYELFGAKYQP